MLFLSVHPKRTSAYIHMEMGARIISEVWFIAGKSANSLCVYQMEVYVCCGIEDCKKNRTSKTCINMARLRGHCW